jgi:hypothetical protein
VGWSLGYDFNWDRDIGYGVPAICDYPGCNTRIDRGLSYVCGGQPYGGETGCGLYFCGKHLYFWRRAKGQHCIRCIESQEPFKAKPDIKEWIDEKAKLEEESLDRQNLR